MVLIEGALRIFFSRTLASERDERSLLYGYHEKLGWFPVADRTNVFTGSVTITTVHNHNGFRDRDHAKGSKPRILVVGDSFVWGYDVEASQRFTEKLQARHPEWEICNVGVSGYGTDQEFLLLQQWFDEFQPAAVLLIFCPQTDIDDNCMNSRYGGYYKPYYIVDSDGGLELKGVPVPRLEKAFFATHRWLGKSYLARLIVRAYGKLKAPAPPTSPDPTAEILLAMEKFVAEKGVPFAVGMESPFPPLKKLLEDCHVPCVDLSVVGAGPERYKADGAHWTPNGHAFVADRLEPLLSDLMNSRTNIQKNLPADLAHKALGQYHQVLLPFSDSKLTPRQTIEAYRELLREMPDFPEALNNLAWVLATCSDPALRNGAEAARLAERACALTDYTRANMVGTLAAAYAEAGRFSEAVTTGEEAARLADGDHNSELREKNRKLVDLYQTGKAYHDESAP